MRVGKTNAVCVFVAYTVWFLDNSFDVDRIIVVGLSKPQGREGRKSKERERKANVNANAIDSPI